MSQTSVKSIVCVFAGYVVPVLQNGALKWKKKLTGVRSRAVTSDHTLKLKLCEEKPQLKFIMLYTRFPGRVVDCSTVSRWAFRFCEVRISIQDDPRSGWPVTATNDTPVVIVSTLLDEDRRKLCEEIAHEANMSTTSVFKIVTQTLQKRKVAAKWVPHHLDEEQKAACKRVAEELLRRYEAEGEQFLKRIVATDEAWI